MVVYDVLFYFFIYGFLGWCTEVAFAAVKQKEFVNRGFLNGPICPVYGFGVAMVVQLLEPYVQNLVLLYIMSVIAVTVLEWLTGFLLEKIFHHRWWDYSDIPGNLNGYVCVPFSLIWGIACVLIVRLVHPFIEKIVNLLPAWLGWCILFLLLVVLFVDIYVTVVYILKFNRQMEKMRDIAGELRSISDHIGENLSKNVLEGLEWQEEQKAKMNDLKKKYQELLEEQSVIGRRLLNAFPKMHSHKFDLQLQDLKEAIKKVKRKK